jgi:hypothetical protein
MACSEKVAFGGLAYIKTLHGLYAVEWLIVLGLVLGAVLSGITGVFSTSVFQLYFAQVALLPQAYLVGLFCSYVVCIAVVNWKDHSATEADIWRTFKRLFLTKKQVLTDIRLLHCIFILFTFFGHLKNLIPHINARLYDEAFAAADHHLLGVSAFDWIHGLLGNNLAAFMSTVYDSYFGVVSYFMLVIVLQRRCSLLTHQALFAFVFTWLAGVCIVYLFPSWGPCFFFPDSIASLPATHSTELQQTLWNHKKVLDADPSNQRVLFAIAGLPSLHCGILFVISYYMSKLHWILGLLMWLATGLTIMATLYLGWHYLVDDLAAVPLAIAGVLAARRFVTFEISNPIRNDQ